MTNTPETDNLARGNHVVPTEFAEKLERERDEARGQRDKAIAMLWRLNVAATDCYNAAFDYSNPPREQDVLPIINEVDEFLTTSCETKPSNP
jgi:hypothetical protein